MLTVLPIPALSVAHAAGRAIINMEVQEQDNHVGTSPKSPAITSEASSNSASPEPVPPHSAADAASSSAGLGPQTAQQAPSDGWPAPPPVPPVCFWSNEFTSGMTEAARQQSSLELAFFMTFLQTIFKEYIDNSPILGCHPEFYLADFQRGFQMGCEVREAFVKSLLMFELKQIGFRMQHQMPNYMPDVACMPM